MRFDITHNPFIPHTGRRGTFPAGIRFVTLLSTLAVAGSATSMRAQTNDAVFPQFQWNFSTPGARANAMGQAFIGVADDASAAVSNPAGLLSLTRPQIYAEYKNTAFRVRRLTAVDSLFTGAASTISMTLQSPSFVSITAPVGGRLAVGFSLHEFLNHQESFRIAPQPVPNSTFVLFPTAAETEFKGTSLSGVTALALSEQVSVGVSVQANRLEARSVATRFAETAGPRATRTNPFDRIVSEVAVNRHVIENDQWRVGFSAGVLVKPSRAFSAGFSFSKGSSFTVLETAEYNPGFSDAPCCGVNRTMLPVPELTVDVPINVPDRLGVGIAVRPVSRLLVTVDVVRTMYSRLVEDFTLIFDSPTFARPGTPTLTGQEFSVRDVSDIHAGTEFVVVPGPRALFLRGGVFTNRDHSVRFSGTSDPMLNATYSAIYNTLPETTEVNGTFGIGATLAQRLQLDAAIVHVVSPSAAKGRKDFILSAAVRF